MMMLLFSALFLLSSSASIFVSTSYLRVDNAFESLNNTIPNYWIVTDVEGKPGQVLYDTTLIESTVISHFSNNLKGIVKSYVVGFYYFDKETLEKSEDRYVTGARISLKTTLFFNTEYKKANTYVVSKGVI